MNDIRWRAAHHRRVSRTEQPLRHRLSPRQPSLQLLKPERLQSTPPAVDAVSRPLHRNAAKRRQLIAYPEAQLITRQRIRFSKISFARREQLEKKASSDVCGNKTPTAENRNEPNTTFKATATLDYHRFFLNGTRATNAQNVPLEDCTGGFTVNLSLNQAVPTSIRPQDYYLSWP